MGKLLQEISASQADLETQNGGSSSLCGWYAAQAIIQAGLCGAGSVSSCAAYNSITQFLSANCPQN